MPRHCLTRLSRLFAFAAFALAACDKSPASPVEYLNPPPAGIDEDASGPVDTLAPAPHAVTGGFRIEVTPATVSLSPSAKQQLSVIGRSQSGGKLSVNAAWRATGGTVSSTGLYTAPAAAGTYRAIATRVGDVEADTSVITVSGSSGGTPPSGASFWVELTPATVTLAPGALQQFSARGKDRNGASFSIRTVWRATGASRPAAR